MPMAKASGELTVCKCCSPKKTYRFAGSGAGFLSWAANGVTSKPQAIVVTNRMVLSLLVLFLLAL
jgi:hypothetical protein